MSTYHMELDAVDNIINTRIKTKIFAIVSLFIALILAIEDLTENESRLQEVLIEFSCTLPFFFLALLIFSFIYSKSLARLSRTLTTEKRPLFEATFSIFWVGGISIIIFYISRGIYFLFSDSILDEESILISNPWGVWVGFIIFLSIVVVLENFVDGLNKRKKLESQNRMLLHSHEMAKYSALMNQINPHFLFNSLNVLSYLVHKSPTSAEKFIEELSKIYRYILQLNDSYIVPLKREIDFISSYIYLQKIRFSDNLIFKSKIEESSMLKMIPPLTLELLIENAIKHNEISEENQLTIELTAKDNQLIVRNNLQLRMDNEIMSNQIGLKNLHEKFNILDEIGPQIYTENGHFIAKITLIEPL